MKPQEIYIKMTITDIAELRYMQHTLLENLNLLSQLDDDYTTNRSIKDSVYWISKILQSIDHESEN